MFARATNILVASKEQVQEIATTRHHASLLCMSAAYVVLEFQLNSKTLPRIFLFTKVCHSQFCTY